MFISGIPRRPIFASPSLVTTGLISPGAFCEAFFSRLTSRSKNSLTFFEALSKQSSRSVNRVHPSGCGILRVLFIVGRDLDGEAKHFQRYAVGADRRVFPSGACGERR